MNTRSSDMDLINDMFNTTYDDTIESEMDEQYYIGKAHDILKKLNDDNYYTFLTTILSRYHSLNDTQKSSIVKYLNIKPVEKIVRVEKKPNKKTNTKPKLNMDDY